MVDILAFVPLVVLRLLCFPNTGDDEEQGQEEQELEFYV